MTEVYTIKQCLDGEISVDETVTTHGWVKTRRDSKLGLSFISLHDGSCFSPIQIVATDNLANYRRRSPRRSFRPAAANRRGRALAFVRGVEPSEHRFVLRSQVVELRGAELDRRYPALAGNDHDRETEERREGDDAHAAVRTCAWILCVIESLRDRP